MEPPFQGFGILTSNFKAQSPTASFKLAVGTHCASPIGMLLPLAPAAREASFIDMNIPVLPFISAQSVNHPPVEFGSLTERLEPPYHCQPNALPHTKLANTPVVASPTFLTLYMLFTSYTVVAIPNAVVMVAGPAATDDGKTKP